MIRRALAIVFALLLAACPLLGLAAQEAPACSHCPAAVSAENMHCHQHAAATEKCHACTGCASCAYFPVAASGNPAISQAGRAAVRAGYTPAHFYHLTSPPLDRPPSSFPA